MASSLSILISSVGYDTELEEYTCSWISVDDENQSGGGITTFVMSDLVAAINLRVISNAKTDHNDRYGSSFGPLTPAKLVGGLV